MEEKKYYKGYWGGSRKGKAAPGKTDGRPTNESKGLPSSVKKQFILYPADLDVLEALLDGVEGNGSMLVRGLIRRAARLSPAEVVEVVALGMNRPPKPASRGRKPSSAEPPRYVHRVGDQGDPANGFCPRCSRLFGGSQQTALTKDGGFIYCLACGWEKS